MEDNSNSKLTSQNNLYGITSLIIGIGLMVFMGALVYEGLEILNPDDESFPNIYIVIMCQTVESLAWMMVFSVSLLQRSLRYWMFAAGVIAFTFSIFLMTAAQKAMFLNIDLVNDNNKVNYDAVKNGLDARVKSQNVVVTTAENNANSKHTQNRDKAREVGSDLDEEENKTDEKRKELNELQKKITITSKDIFIWGQELTGITARKLEAGWLIFRSLFFECCAILFLATGSALLSRRQNPELHPPYKMVDNTKIIDMTKRPIFKIFSNPTKRSTRRKPQHRVPDDQLFTLANQLLKQDAIFLNRRSIIKGLKTHHDIGIGSGRAARILEYLLNESSEAQIKLEVNR